MADADSRHRAGHRPSHRAARRAAARTQTWLMVGVALGILGIIVFTGHPEPARRADARPSPARRSRRIPSVCGTIRTACASGRAGTSAGAESE